MKKLLYGAGSGVILHAIANPLISNMITGTSATDLILVNTLPTIIGCGGFVVVLRLFLGGV